MHRIDTPTAMIDKFGQGKNGFTNGDTTSGRRATQLTDSYWDAIQEEVCTAIEEAGINLDKTKHNQLSLAIKTIIATNALLKANNLSDVANVDAARNNIRALAISGGDVGYLNNAAHYGINPGVWEGAGGLAGQYINNTAPYIIPRGNTAPADVSTYFPIVKGIINTAKYGYGTAISFGALVSGNGDFARIALHVIGDNGASKVWIFDPNNGTFSCPGDIYTSGAIGAGGNINASGGIYEKNQRVYSPNNKPSAGDIGAVRQGGGSGMNNNIVYLGWDGSKLIGQIDNTGMGAIYCEYHKPTASDVNAIARDGCDYAGFVSNNSGAPYMHHASSGADVLLARQDWVYQNFVTGMRQGSIIWSDRIFITPVVPNGCVVVGADNNGSSDTAQMKLAYCPLQVNINGSWITISRV